MHREVPFVGDELVQFHDLAQQRGHARWHPTQGHHALLGLGDIQQDVEHRQHALGFLRALGQGGAGGGGRGVVGQGGFGGGAQAGQRGAEVVCDVVERLAGGPEQRAVFFQHAVELPGEFRQFACGLILRHALGEIAGGDDPPGRRQHPTHGCQCAMRERRAADQAQQQGGSDDHRERDLERPQKRGVTAGDTSDQQRRAVTQGGRNEGQVAVRIQRDAQDLPRAGHGQAGGGGAFGQARQVERRTGKQDALAAARHQHEETAAVPVGLFALDERVEGGQPAALVQGGAALEPGGEDRLLALFEKAHHQQVQQPEKDRRAQREHPGVPDAQAHGETAPKRVRRRI